MLLSALSTNAQTISTAVGGFIVDRQPALSTPLANPHGVALDVRGNIIIADSGNNVIRRVDAISRISTIIAGGGTRLDDSLPIAGTTANIPFPAYVRVDRAGNILLSDASFRIRKITPEGLVTTLAGNGRFGFSGDGGPALYAEIGPPFGMALDGSGNLFFADCYNSVVRKVEASTGMIRTVVGNRTFGFSGDGGPATQAALSCPTGVALDPSGNLYLVDANNNRLRRVDVAGIITTVAGNGFQELAPDGIQASPAVPLGSPIDVAVDRAGNVFISERFGRVRKIAVSSGLLSTVAGGGTSTLDGIPGNRAYVGQPLQLFLDGSGNLYFADSGRNAIRRVDAVSGMISTIVGTDEVFDGSTALSVVLTSPIKLAFDRFGNLLIADQSHNRLRKLDTQTGIVTTIAGGTGQPGYGGDGGPATSALFQFPAAMAVNPSGDIFLSDTRNHRIRKIDGRSGLITTIAGTGQVGSTGDGGPAIQATLFNPDGLLLDSVGNLYVADAGNGIVRKIDAASGTISTVVGDRRYGYSGDGGPAIAASLFTPTGLAFDKAGNLLIADRGAHVIRKVDLRTNVISTVVGTGVEGYSGDNGPAELARLSQPNVLAVDEAGNLFFGDGSNNVVRKVAAGTAIITTVAGTGQVGFTGDGALATLATINYPAGLAFDAAGNLFIADAGNNRIRKVTPAPLPPVLGVAPTALSFSSLQGGAAPAAQTFHVLNTNFAALAWSLQLAGTGTNWLTVTPTSGVAPTLLTVRVNPSGLAAGSYRATLVVSSPGAIGSPQTISILLTVDAPAQPVVALSSQLLSFQAVSGGINPTPQALSIANAGSGTLEWTATAQTAPGTNWLELSAASGTAPSPLFVSVNTRGLGPGVYEGTVTVEDRRGGAPATATVFLTVTAPASSILLSHTGFQFTAVEGAAALPSQRFSVLNAGQGAMNWNAQSSTTSGGGWLQVSPASETSDSRDIRNSPTVTVSANAAGLKAGTYNGLIVVSAPGAVNAPQLVSVVLRVLPPGSAPPPVLEPTGLLFLVRAGSISPVVQAVSLFNPGAAMSFSAAASLASGANWLSITPASGRLLGAGSLGVQVNPRDLSPAPYRATITLSFANGSVLDVAVLLVVTSATVSAADGHRLTETCTEKEQHLLATTLANNFGLPQGWPQPLLVRVVTECGTEVSGSAVTVSFDNGDRPLVLADHRNGVYSGTWTPQNVAGRVKLAVTAIHPLLRPATLELGGSVGTSNTPQIFRYGAVNAASFRRFAPLAPGSIFSVFGANLVEGVNLSPSVPLAKTLGGLSLKLGSFEVPLFYAASGQINAQVPFEIPENTTLPLVASIRGAFTMPEPFGIAAAQPGIFTINQSGSGQGAVLNAAAVLVDLSAPAAAGDVLQVFCTGLGATDPQVPSGMATPNTPLHRAVREVKAKIGGVDALVQFAGLAPGFVGLYQVNVVVPSGVTPGNAVPLVLTQSAVDSNVVTIAVK